MSGNLNPSTNEYPGMNVQSTHRQLFSENMAGASINFDEQSFERKKDHAGEKVEDSCIEMIHAMLLFGETEEVRFRIASRILLWATRKRFDSLLLLIVQKIPEVRNATDAYGNTALHISAYLCHTECMKNLLMSGCDREARNNKGYTPLHMAVKGGQMTSVCWLCDSGVDLNSIDNEQYTPLMLAITWNYSKLAQILLRYGCDFNRKGPNGRTALHLAVLYENVEIVQMLIEFQANVEIMDNNGRRALHYAGYVGNTTAVGILVQAGANTRARDFTGKIPSHMTTNHVILQLLRRN